MRPLPLLLAAFALGSLACAGGKSDDEDDPGLFEDQDGDDDGYPYDEDCNDDNPAVHPGAAEVCDPGDVDEDCDGAADSADPDVQGAIEAFHDADGDTHGDPAAPAAVCEVSAGYVTTADDCDDSDAAIHPGATEVCDDADTDEDCDGAADDADDDFDLSTGSTWYADGDADGYGASAVVACDLAAGRVAESGDCDDGAPAVHPAATETCNGVDDDCDGATDGDDAEDADPWYRDRDRDGHGDPAAVVRDCEAPAGYVASGDDCDDDDDAVHPGATESCNNVDDDCDGVVDPDTSSDATTWYADADGDTFGDASAPRDACDRPAGYASTGTDCDDTTSAVSPADLEVCDSADRDEDCDGVADDDDSSVTSTSRTTWYRDADGDGYGTSTSTRSACEAPSGYVGTGTDCDDADAAQSPAATEVCDAADQDEDCDGLADDDDSSVSAGTRTTHYVDSDRDGYGSTSAVSRCDADSGYASNDDDCDDTRGSVSPGDPEVCDAADLDEDCDGLVEDADPSVSSLTTWYLDADGDGYGDNGVSVAACAPPTGYVVTGGDCDDDDAAVSPSATEACGDDVDDDCDGALTCEYGPADAVSVIYAGGEDYLGTKLIRDGDADGDGVEAVWASAWMNADGGSVLYAGAAYLIEPGVTGALDAGYTVQYTRDDGNAYAGWSLGAGDWDGDGLSDVIVGAQGESRVWWALAGGAGSVALDTAWGYTSGGDATGYAISVGDVDADGDHEVLVGGPEHSSYAGVAYLYDEPRSSRGVVSATTTTMNGEAESSSLVNTGSAVLLVDLDGDGGDDTVLGAMYRNYGSNSSAGCVYVYYGAPSAGSVGGADLRIRGSSTVSYVGIAVEGGDMDGDGRDDLLVGASDAIHLYTDAPTGYIDVSADNVTFNGVMYAPHAFDLDQDGALDLVTASPSEASVEIFYGGGGFSGTLDDDDRDVVLSSDDGNYYGYDVLLAPDWDGDGLDDLLVSSPDDRSYGGWGVLYVYPGTLFGG